MRWGHGCGSRQRNPDATWAGSVAGHRALSECYGEPGSVSYLWDESQVAEYLKIAKAYGFPMCPDTGTPLCRSVTDASTCLGRPEAVNAALNFRRLDQKATPFACRWNPAGNASRSILLEGRGSRRRSGRSPKW